MTLEGWLARRGLRALRRAGLQMAAVAVLALGVLVWLGVREAGLPARALAATQAVYAQERLTTAVTIKRLALVSYLAKVRRNAILAEVTGRPNSEDACVGLTGIRSLPPDNPCIANNLQAFERIWLAGLGPKGPPVERATLYDAWGSPICINEAEYLCARGDGWCPQDVLRSVGPDGAHSTADDMVDSVKPFVYRQR